MPDWERIAVVGHSFVRRLYDFTCRADSEKTEDSQFNLRNTTVRWFFKGGLGASDVLPRWQRQLADFKPQAVIFMIGDNDVERGVDIEGLAGLIQAMASLLLSERFGTRLVLVCQIMPRFESNVYRFESAYNTLAKDLNGALYESFSGSERLRFRSHDFACIPWTESELEEFPAKFIRHDGVHLSKYGNAKQYRSIKFALHKLKYMA